MAELSTNIVAVIETMQGESELLKNAVDVYDLHFAVDSPGSAGVMGGAGVGVSKWSNVSFSANVDTAANQMIAAAGNTKHLPKVSFIFYKGTGGGAPEQYYKIEISDVVVTQVTVTGMANELLTVRYSLDYSEFKAVYSPQSSKGSMGAQYPVQFKIKNQKAA
jgi:type VI secretion system secreted protein Hcp